MQAQLPWGLILIFLSIFLFYYLNRKAKARREERKNKLLEIRQALLDSLNKKSEGKDRSDDENE